MEVGGNYSMNIGELLNDTMIYSHLKVFVLKK